jgi:hypothetical protein
MSLRLSRVGQRELLLGVRFSGDRLTLRSWQGGRVKRDGTKRPSLKLQTASVPDAFDLSFDGGRTLRHCRVLWRTATEIVVFESFEGAMERISPRRFPPRPQKT